MIARSRLQLARVAARAGAHSAHSSVLTCSHHNRRARLSRLQQRGAHAGSERCTSGPGDRWRPMRQAAARERCTSAQLRRSNSRRRAHLGRVRGRAGRRRLVNGGVSPEYLRRLGSREWASGARLQVPGRAAAGAGERSCSQRGADDARAAAGTHARGCCAGVHGANTVRRRGARVRRPLVGAGPPGSSWCPS